MRVKAAGVGPWDALIREGKSVAAQKLPVKLGSDIAGVLEKVGPAQEDRAECGGVELPQGTVIRGTGLARSVIWSGRSKLTF